MGVNLVMGFREWWGRLWKNTEWISLVATLLATLALLGFTKWTSLVVDDLHSVIDRRTQTFMVGDRELVWGICPSPPLKSDTIGHVLYLNASMVCDGAHPEKDGSIDNSASAVRDPGLMFLDSLTHNMTRRCYDVAIEVLHPSQGELNCTILFEDLRSQGNTTSLTHMPVRLKDVISIPNDDMTRDVGNHMILFRMATWNSSVVMVVNNSDWFSRDGNADLLITMYQNAVCHKTVLDRKLPILWVSRFECKDGVEVTYRDTYQNTFLEIQARYTLRPVESLGIIGRYDDWYAIYTGVLAGFFGSCATFVALILVALMGATFNMGASVDATQEAKWKAREAEKENRLEAILQRLEAGHTSPMGPVRASTAGVNGHKGQGISHWSRSPSSAPNEE